MTVVPTIIAMSVHLIFMFRREILFDKKKFKTLVIVSLGLVGLFYLTKGLGRNIRNFEVLTIPFLVLMVFS
jgi:hypothetical protein